MTSTRPLMRHDTNLEDTAASIRGTSQYQDTPVNVKLVLSALWIATLFVFAYFDLFAFFREDVLRAGLDGEMAGMAVTQGLLTAALLYILVPSLMVVLSLVLKPRVNRVTTVAVSLLYAVTVGASCIGETWAYYFLGSAVEVVLLLAIARTAWKWPRQDVAS
jgi:Family of unknown function (DUF6326)